MRTFLFHSNIVVQVLWVSKVYFEMASPNDNPRQKTIEGPGYDARCKSHHFLICIEESIKNLILIKTWNMSRKLFKEIKV